MTKQIEISSFAYSYLLSVSYFPCFPSGILRSRFILSSKCWAAEVLCLANQTVLHGSLNLKSCRYLNITFPGCRSFGYRLWRWAGVLKTPRLGVTAKEVHHPDCWCWRILLCLYLVSTEDFLTQKKLLKVSSCQPYEVDTVWNSIQITNLYNSVFCTIFDGLRI